MISDEKRREVAARLRGISAMLIATRSERDIEETYYEVLRGICTTVADVVGDNGNVLRALADLIDRGTCRNVYDEYAMGSCDNGFECSVCGNRVEDYEHYAVKGVFNYCSKCGRKVVER